MIDTRSKICGLAAAGALMLLSAATAFADGMPRSTGGGSIKDPVAAPAPFSWTGFYIGGHVGEAWGVNASGSDFSQTGTGVTFDNQSFGDGSRNSLSAGVHGGYNWQFNQSWVIGVESDITWFGESSRRSSRIPTVSGFPNALTLTMSDEQHSLISVRGRLGYTWDKFMVFGTLGGAWSKTTDRGNIAGGFPGLCNGSACDTGGHRFTDSGLAAGVGLEYAVTPNILLRTEYLYYAVGSTNSASVCASAPFPCGAAFGPITYKWTTDDIQEVRAGISVKF